MLYFSVMTFPTKSGTRNKTIQPDPISYSLIPHCDCSDWGLMVKKKKHNTEKRLGWANSVLNQHSRRRLTSEVERLGAVGSKYERKL